MHLMQFRVLLAILLSVISTPAISTSQIPLNALHSEAGADDQGEYYQFPRPIRRVAVIGAGASGLQVAASLIENRFEVRLFERARNPGGMWFYQDEKPAHTPFP